MAKTPWPADIDGFGIKVSGGGVTGPEAFPPKGSKVKITGGTGEVVGWHDDKKDGVWIRTAVVKADNLTVVVIPDNQLRLPLDGKKKPADDEPDAIESMEQTMASIPPEDDASN